jgi:hypothetical protein
MINMPQIVKTQRELTGEFSVTFKSGDGEGKEFTKAFSEIRAGVSWPIRLLPGYIAIIGLYAGSIFGKENSHMLIYEREYPSSIELMTDAYNRANDLRFHHFYTDMQNTAWQGFNIDFQKRIRTGLGSKDIRIIHSPFAQDFIIGKDVIKRMAGQKALNIPSASILMNQLRNMTPQDLDCERPDQKFHAINALRYVLVAWDQMKSRPRGESRGEKERSISVEGWA